MRKHFQHVRFGLLAAAVGACGAEAGTDEDIDPISDAATRAPDAAADGGTAEGCAALGCSGSEVCDARSDACRARVACEALTCSLHQLCSDDGQGDATCGECETGYDWDDVARRCVATPSCTPGTPGDISQQCAAENTTCDESDGEAQCGACISAAELRMGRCVVEGCAALEGVCVSPQVCVEDALGASCGGCEAGYRWDDDATRCVQTCALVTCGPDEWCVEGQGSDDAACVPRIDCGREGEVANPHGQCVRCSQCYEELEGALVKRPGVQGIGYEGRTEGAICVCELEDGFFQALTGEVLSCDGDHDGWLNRRATILAGTAMADEARCSVPRVDRFVLQSDDLPAEPREGVTRDLTVTIDDLLVRYPDIRSDAWEEFNGAVVLRLIEDEALDETDKFLNRYEDLSDEFALRSYGSGSSPLAAAEANPLTKLCNHPRDDLNMDGVADVEQSQQGSAPRGGEFFHLAYFAELASGRYVDDDGDGIGSYVISERVRAGATEDALPLPLGSASGGEAPYAATCLRSRDVSYPGVPGPNAPAPIGYDFAQFQCDAPRSGCQVEVDGRLRVAYDGRPPRYVEALERLAGSVAGAERRWDSPPDRGYVADRPLWPGMNHHSQFKCVPPAGGLPASAAGRTFTHYDCALEEREGAEGPAFACLPLDEAPPSDAVRYHWAAADYAPYGASSLYERGCIDEAAEWGRAQAESWDVCGNWSGRHSGDQPFTTQGLLHGQFTCQSSCTRGGLFVIVEEGGLCCYGDQESVCNPGSFTPDAGPVLMCGVDSQVVESVDYLEETCDDALGMFLWADETTSIFDPNHLQWSSAGNPLNESAWQ